MKKYESFSYYNDTLNTDFWNNFELDERIKEKLLTIANEFYVSSKLEFPIKDITLTGSLANFNYNDHSDFDVHIIIEYPEGTEFDSLIATGIDSYRINWNLKHDIKIKGYDVELYVQDIAEEHLASGVYSLLTDKWLVKPIHNAPDVDEQEIDSRVKIYKSGINRLLELTEEDMTVELSNHYYKTSHEMKKKIHGLRKIGLLTDKAEFSTGNLIFKQLRNSGHFGVLIEIINKFYDKIYIQ